MRNKTNLLLFAITVSTAFVFSSCQKSIDEPVAINQKYNEANVSNPGNQGVAPYKFERINEHNFTSQGWIEQQINIVSGITIFSDQSDYVEIVCGPENNSDPRLIQGAVTMNLPTGANPTLRRIRLRRGGYSGTLLDDLNELKYSTYVVHNSPAIMVLQIDVNGDAAKDFNIFYEPRTLFQPAGFPPLVFNTWQQWDALHQGVWGIEIAAVPLPGGLADGVCIIPEIVAAFPNARIIDTPPLGQNGEGVRLRSEVTHDRIMITPLDISMH